MTILANDGFKIYATVPQCVCVCAYTLLKRNKPAYHQFLPRKASVCKRIWSFPFQQQGTITLEFPSTFTERRSTLILVSKLPGTPRPTTSLLSTIIQNIKFQQLVAVFFFKKITAATTTLSICLYLGQSFYCIQRQQKERVGTKVSLLSLPQNKN